MADKPDAQELATPSQTGTKSSGQSGGDRRWEQVAEIVDDTPEAAGKVGRGAANRDPKEDDQHPKRTIKTEIDKNVDKNYEQV